jgi:hypothetical protein
MIPKTIHCGLGTTEDEPETMTPYCGTPGVVRIVAAISPFLKDPLGDYCPACAKIARAKHAEWSGMFKSVTYTSR